VTRRTRPYFQTGLYRWRSKSLLPRSSKKTSPKRKHIMPSQQAIYQYDKDGRLTTVTFANGAQVTYNYDSMGNRTSVVTALAANSFVFNGFRLSLSSSNPAPTADILAATTLYLVPFANDLLTLLNSSGSLITDEADGATISVSLSSLLAAHAYNIYGSDPTGSGTVTLSIGAAWTNLTTPSETLVAANPGGFLVLSTDTTKRYLGTVYATANGQVNDAQKDRGVFNSDNRLLRLCQAADATSSYTLTSGAGIRARDNNTTEGVGRFGVMFGIPQVEPFQVHIRGYGHSNTTNALYNFGIGVDSTTAFTDNYAHNIAIVNGVDNGFNASFLYQPAQGRHFIQAMESTNAGTATLTSQNGNVMRALVRI